MAAYSRLYIMDQKNRLYFGDNLKILREYVPDASVDLIYLDPPFNSSATYPSADGLFKEKTGNHPLVPSSPWRGVCYRFPSLLRRGNRGGWRQRGLESEAVYREIVERGTRLVGALRIEE